jgi:HD-like signal output (HDOD) protein/CheY-like chemotaxis protein
MSTILIVEDAPLVRELVEAVLVREGYETLCATDGAEAIEILSSRRPDLILLDLILPRTDGLAVLAHIHAAPRLRGTPIIVLSGLTDRQRIREAARYGISAYLLKAQFSLRQLLEKVRELLSGPAGEAQPLKLAPAPASPAESPLALEPGNQQAPLADPAEAIRTLKPIATRAEVLERIERSGELRALSPTVTQVLKLTGNAHCSTEAVAKAISHDHAIALKIMKLANSTVYTRGEPVDSVHKAVVRIGIERIRQAVLNISVVERLSAPAFDHHLSTEEFWEHSIACGVIASELAHAADPAQTDTAFTLGLLHDVGRIILAEQFGERYLQVLEMAEQLQAPLEQVETRMLLLNHADVMERILRLWNFSQDLIAPIVCHHLSAANARSSAPRQVEDVLRLSLANRLCYALLLGSSGNDTIYPTQEFCAALDLDASVIALIEAQARQQTQDIKLAMLAHGGTSTASWVPRQDKVRSALGAALNPLFIGEAPAIDALRIFCDQIRSPEQHHPNIAIVHLTHTRERNKVASRLRQEEQTRGTPNLPLIVVSAGGKLRLDDAVLSGRPWTALAMPFAIPRFVTSVRGLLNLRQRQAA